MASPTLPTGVDTGGTILLPGIVALLSFILGPSLILTSNRCVLWYTSTMVPLSFITTCEL